MEKLDEAMLETLKTDLSGVSADYMETGLDVILDDGLLKDIPVVNSIVSLYKTGVNIRERFLIKKLLVFLTTLSDTWTPSDGYMRSQKYGSLHKHVMVLKYGEDVIREAYDNDFVIDHINNNGFDCMYTNLEIIPRKLNATKGLTYDEEREKHIDFFALNFLKDEDTNEFQIGIGFNKPVDTIMNSKIYPVASIYFKYGRDYKTLFWKLTVY